MSPNMFSVTITSNCPGFVASLKRYKEEHGIDFVDLAREEWMLQYLRRFNQGPLSREGLSELYHELLALMKREVMRES